MFLALRELKHAKFRFFMIGMILLLISWLVFILSGLEAISKFGLHTK
ncbi:hypothetical protein CLV97_14810 [Planifilum fimeticola]|uniref:Uncharacterized protein n=1 Tax=Planifilum fimeticola TaxID=201975 RepID=A0A2T0L9Z5_9BACL|nr:hypothetical protein CLV97_14810 [Planifilum fimeticola]